jgi:hypothetical protein
MSSDPAEDPVARNRSTHPRKDYDREALGADFTRRWGLFMGAILIGSTLLLVAFLLAR